MLVSLPDNGRQCLGRCNIRVAFGPFVHARLGDSPAVKRPRALRLDFEVGLEIRECPAVISLAQEDHAAVRFVRSAR